MRRRGRQLLISVTPYEVTMLNIEKTVRVREYTRRRFGRTETVCTHLRSWPSR